MKNEETTTSKIKIITNEDLQKQISRLQSAVVVCTMTIIVYVVFTGYIIVSLLEK